MPFHWHSEFEIIRVEEGEFTVTVNDTEYRLSAGDLMFISGGMIHGGVPLNCVYLCVVFDPVLLYGKGEFSCASLIRTAVDSGSSSVYPFVPAGNAELNRLTDILMGALRTDTPGNRLIALGSLYSIFGELYNSHAVTDCHTAGKDRFSGEQKLKAVLHFIEEHYQEELSLNQLSSIAGMNPRYFCEFFKKCTHRSPIEYLMLYRIDSACRMLKLTDCSVTDAAFSCGFNDLSYFVKIFKRYKNLTPRQYRKKHESFMNELNKRKEPV